MHHGADCSLHMRSKLLVAGQLETELPRMLELVHVISSTKQVKPQTCHSMHTFSA